MTKTFEALIDNYIDFGVGQVDHFISASMSNELRGNLLALIESRQLKEAGIGNKRHFQHNKSIRSDSIYWLDRNQNISCVDSFLDLIDAFIKFLNETCYTGITGYEFHYALYEKGSYYKRHLDQFKDNQKRAFSLIIYLNENWQAEDGGELCIFLKSGAQMIQPLNCRSVFFKSSELEHEVLLSHKSRMSITGWLKTG